MVEDNKKLTRSTVKAEPRMYNLWFKQETRKNLEDQLRNFLPPNALSKVIDETEEVVAIEVAYLYYQDDIVPLTEVQSIESSIKDLRGRMKQFLEHRRASLVLAGPDGWYTKRVNVLVAELTSLERTLAAYRKGIGKRINMRVPKHVPISSLEATPITYYKGRPCYLLRDPIRQSGRKEHDLQGIVAGVARVMLEHGIELRPEAKESSPDFHRILETIFGDIGWPDQSARVAIDYAWSKIKEMITCGIDRDAVKDNMLKMKLTLLADTQPN